MSRQIYSTGTLIVNVALRICFLTHRVHIYSKWNSYWQDFALYTLPLSATEPPASLLALVRTQEAGDPHHNRSNKNNKSLERVSLGPHIHYAALQERRGPRTFLTSVKDEEKERLFIFSTAAQLYMNNNRHILMIVDGQLVYNARGAGMF